MLRLHKNEYQFEHSDLVKSLSINDNLLKYYDELKNDDELKLKISQFCDVNPKNIMLTAGGISAIECLFRNLLSSENKLIAVKPTYSAIKRHAHKLGVSIEWVDINYDKTCKTNIFNVGHGDSVYICNPNNPNGTLWDVNDLANFCQKNNENNVIIDEVYIDFAQSEIKSMSQFVNKLNNLYVIRSFSKAYGLAGVRLGYIISSACNINKLSKNYESMHVTDIAKMYGIAIMDSLDFYNQKIKECIQKKAIISDKLRELNIHHIDSHTNFIMVYIDNDHKNSLINCLKENGILVRDMWEDYKIDKFIRINIPDVIEPMMNIFTRFKMQKNKPPLEILFTNTSYMCELIDLLKNATDILNHHNIPYWISDGTLLGYARNRKILKWDYDVDFSMLKRDEYQLLCISEDLEKNRLCLIKNRFNVYWQIRPKKYVTEPIEDFYKSDNYKNTPTIDIFIYEIEENYPNRLINTDERFRIENKQEEDAYVYMEYNLEDIFPTFKSTLNSISVNIPKEYNSILITSLGEDYQDNVVIKKNDKIYEYNICHEYSL